MKEKIEHIEKLQSGKVDEEEIQDCLIDDSIDEADRLGKVP